MIQVYNENIRKHVLPKDFYTACITDPPYGISFMGESWDKEVPSADIWQKILISLRPGAYLLAFSSTKLQHRMGTEIEKGGFIIRDSLMWGYGGGMPKGYNISKAIEAYKKYGKTSPVYLKKIEQAGNGKSYKLAGKNNGILGEKKIFDRKEYTPQDADAISYDGYSTCLVPCFESIIMAQKPIEGNLASNILKYNTGCLNMNNIQNGQIPKNLIVEQEAGLDKYLYCGKPKKKDKYNNHPTVKPTELMEYLLTIVSNPKDNYILDPFAGSGTTGVAAKNLGINCDLVEIDAKFVDIIKERLNAPS